MAVTAAVGEGAGEAVLDQGQALVQGRDSVVPVLVLLDRRAGEAVPGPAR